MTALSPLPDFVLTAVHSGYVIDRATVAGRPLVLLFHDQSGIDTVRSLQESVRRRWPRCDQLLIASVVNLHAMPWIVRGLAERALGGAYREAARHVPPELDATEYVLILPDRSGKTCDALGVTKSSPPTALVVDSQWRLHARLDGEALVESTVDALESLFAEPASPQPALDVGFRSQ